MIDITWPEGRLNIHPGGWYFGRDYQHIYTVLGSCVALTMWHPKLKFGGLCHYLLPEPPQNRGGEKEVSPEEVGRYAKTALGLMKQSMLRYAKLTDYELGLFGGSDMLSDKGIGRDNISYAERWLEHEKLTLVRSDVGGAISRSIMLDMATGEIFLRQYDMSK